MDYKEWDVERLRLEAQVEDAAMELLVFSEAQKITLTFTTPQVLPEFKLVVVTIEGK